MASTVEKIIKETNWAAVSFIGSAALASILAFASLKSDVRDLGTQLSATQAQVAITAAEVGKLRDRFVDRGFTRNSANEFRL